MHTFLINTISNLDLSGLFEMLYFKEVEDKNLSIYKSDIRSIHDMTDLISESFYKDSTINDFNLIITIGINEKDIPNNISYDTYKELITFYTYHNFIKNLLALGFRPNNISFIFIDDIQNDLSSQKINLDLSKLIKDSINLFPWSLNEDIRNDTVKKSSYSDRNNEYLQDWLNNLYQIPGFNLYLNETEEFIDGFVNNLENYYLEIVRDNDRFGSDEPERELDEHTQKDRLINLKSKFFNYYISVFKETSIRSKFSTLSFNIYKKNHQEIKKILFLAALNILNNINKKNFELLEPNISQLEDKLIDYQKLLKGNEERLNGDLNYGTFFTFNFDSLIKDDNNYSTNELDENLKNIKELVKTKKWKNVRDFKKAVDNFKNDLNSLLKNGETIFQNEVENLLKKFDEEIHQLNISLRNLKNYQNVDAERITKKKLDSEKDRIDNKIKEIEEELLKQNLSDSKISNSSEFISSIDNQTNYYINVLNSYKTGTFWFLALILLASFIYPLILGGFIIIFDYIVLFIFVLVLCGTTYFIIQYQFIKQKTNLINFLQQTDKKAEIIQESLIETYKQLNKRFSYYIPNLIILNAYKNYLENVISNYYQKIEQKEEHLIETKELLNNLTTILRAFNTDTTNSISYDKLVMINKSILENSDVYTLIDKDELKKLGD